MDSASLEHPVSDGVITLRAPEPTDRSALLAGRDEAFDRFLAEASAEPAPHACIVDQSGTVAGWIDHDRDRAWLRTGEVNIGYALAPEHRGRGYATRAVRLLVDHLATDPEFTAATLLIDPANAASLAVAVRAGFEQVGEVDGELFFRLPAA